MYIGPNNANYYSQYYPYVGAPIQVLGTSQYDNGQYVFNYYQNFGNLSSLPSGWTYVGNEQSPASFYTNYTSIPAITSTGYNDGIITTSNYNIQNMILDIYADAPIATGTSWSVLALGAGVQTSGWYPNPESTFNGFQYKNSGNAGVFNLYVAGTSIGSINYTYIPTIYSIGFSNSYTYFLVNYSQVSSTTNVPSSFSSPIGFGVQETQNNNPLLIYWVLLRSLPPNDVMPSIYIG